MKRLLLVEVLDGKVLPEQALRNFVERSLCLHPLPWTVIERGSSFVVIADKSTDIAICDSRESANSVVCLAESLDCDEVDMPVTFEQTNGGFVPIIHRRPRCFLPSVEVAA